MSDADLEQMLDLANVPEPMRSQLRKQVGRLPAPVRNKLLREGSPLLAKLVAKARAEAREVAPMPASAARAEPDADIEAAAGASRPNLGSAPRERPPTIAPGDSGSQVAWLATSAAALVGAVWYALQG